MSLTTFCRLPEHIHADARTSKWDLEPGESLKYAILSLVPGLDFAHLKTACDWAFAQWPKCCGLRAAYTENAAEAQVLVSGRSIDGPQGILAETELPSPGAQAVNLWLDTGEAWTTDFTSVERHIILGDVLWHEIGHALGMGHAPSGSANIMAPIYNPQITQAGSWDRSESQARYGPPVLSPVSPVPSGGASMNWTPILQVLITLLQSPFFQAFLESLAKKQALSAGPLTAEQFQAHLTEFMQAQ